MADLETKIADAPLQTVELLQDFTDKLTLKRIFTVLLAGIVATIIFSTYENRDALFQQAYTFITGQHSAPEQITWDVSKKTKDDLALLVHNSRTVIFAMVTEVDLQKNRRIPKYWFLSDPNESDIRLRAASMLPQSVFDYDSKNTAQMVAVLNNEFTCARYSDTVFNKIFPDMQKKMPVICRTAIPPFYGRFSGILTLGLKIEPSRDELDSIRLEASRLAVEIYLRDIIKKPVPGQPKS